MASQVPSLSQHCSFPTLHVALPHAISPGARTASTGTLVESAGGAEWADADAFDSAAKLTRVIPDSCFGARAGFSAHPIKAVHAPASARMAAKRVFIFRTLTQELFAATPYHLLE
jgi:hypothetical protein